MRALVQRVKQAKVTVSNEVIGVIDHGILLFLGIHKEDDEGKIPWIAERVVHLRMFEDEAGKMHHSLLDVGGGLLVVSQFTLYGSCEQGRRPSFIETMPPEGARMLYEAFVRKGQELLGEDRVATGQFGAEMAVELINDGPVTFLLER